jgi:hypothetical protein
MFRFRTVIAVLSILIISFSISIAQDGVQQITVTYTNEGISVSSTEIAAGLTTIVIDNQSDTHNGGPIGRFKDGMTMEDLAAAAAENPFAAILVFDLYGSLSGAPGADQSITVDLQPGNYVFLGQAGMMGNMTVVDSGATTQQQPEHAVNVVMVDFAYGTPSVIPAGEQIWRVRNEGEQIHEFLIISVKADTSVEEATEMFRSMGSVFNVMAGSSPISPLLIWGPQSPNHVAWIPVNLESGTYALGTLLPDLTTVGTEGAPMMQLDHDMVRIFTVE